MDDLIEILRDIKDELVQINEKLCMIDTISDTLTDIKGYGSYNSISDVCDKIDDLMS